MCTINRSLNTLNLSHPSQITSSVAVMHGGDYSDEQHSWDVPAFRLPMGGRMESYDHNSMKCDTKALGLATYINILAGACRSHLAAHKALIKLNAPNWYVLPGRQCGRGCRHPCLTAQAAAAFSHLE